MTAIAEERAENYDYERLGNLDAVNTKLTYMISDYLHGSLKVPYLLVGGRGTGKTFNTIKVLSGMVKENPDFVPAMLVFKKHGDITVLEPEAIASPEVWGERIGIYDQQPSDIIRRADAVGFDDFHYISEEVAEGRYPVGEVLRFADRVLSSSKEGKKTILISDTTLDEYARKIGSEEYDEMILKFGFCNPSWMHDRNKARRAFNERNASAIHEVPAMLFWDWQRLFGSFHVKTDVYAAMFLFDYNSKPRSLARFLNIAKAEEKITVGDLSRAALELLEEEKPVEGTRRLYELLFRMPVIDVHPEADPPAIAAISRYLERKNNSLQGIDRIMEISNELFLPEVKKELRDGGLLARAERSDKVTDFDVEMRLLYRNGAKKIAAYAESKGLMTEELKKALKLAEKTPSIIRAYKQYGTALDTIDNNIGARGRDMNLEKEEADYLSRLIRSQADRFYVRKGGVLDTKFVADRAPSAGSFWILDQPFKQIFNPVAAVD